MPSLSNDLMCTSFKITFFDGSNTDLCRLTMIGIRFSSIQTVFLSHIFQFSVFLINSMNDTLQWHRHLTQDLKCVCLSMNTFVCLYRLSVRFLTAQFVRWIVRTLHKFRIVCTFYNWCLPIQIFEIVLQFYFAILLNVLLFSVRQTNFKIHVVIHS